MCKHFNLVKRFCPTARICTERGILSVARFCYVFPGELQGPAWAVGSYSISQSAGETYQNIIFKTLRQIGRPALYTTCIRIRNPSLTLVSAEEAVGGEPAGGTEAAPPSSLTPDMEPEEGDLLCAGANCSESLEAGV